MDVAETKPNGDDVFNKFQTSEEAEFQQGQGNLCDSKEVSKSFDPLITMNSSVEEKNDDQIDDQVNHQNDLKEEHDEQTIW